MTQITETAIRSVRDAVQLLTVWSLNLQVFLQASASKPSLDAIANFRTAIHNSLRKGITAMRTMSLEFPRHVDNFLMYKGRPVKNTPGRLFNRDDFPSSYFSDDHFTLYIKFGEGHLTVFPIIIYVQNKVVAWINVFLQFLFY